MGLRFDERLSDEREKDYRTRPSRGVFDGTFESQLALAGVTILENKDLEYEEEE